MYEQWASFRCTEIKIPTANKIGKLWSWDKRKKAVFLNKRVSYFWNPKWSPLPGLLLSNKKSSERPMSCVPKFLKRIHATTRSVQNVCLFKISLKLWVLHDKYNIEIHLIYIVKHLCDSVKILLLSSSWMNCLYL